MRAKDEDARLGSIRLERVKRTSSFDSLGLDGFEIWTTSGLMADILATMKLGTPAAHARGMTAHAVERMALVELDYLSGKKFSVAHVGEVLANLLRRSARVVLVHDSKAEREIARTLVASATRHLWTSALKRRASDRTNIHADVSLFHATVLLAQRGGLRSVPVEVRARTQDEAATILRAQFGKKARVVQDPAVFP